MRVFVDTNILLNAFLNRDDALSNRVVAHLLESENLLYLNTITILNINYILRKELQRSRVKEIIQFLIDHFILLDSNRETIQNALDSSFSDFEDAVQYFSCKEIPVDMILTDDKNGFQGAQIDVVNAQDYFKQYIKAE